MKPYVNPDEAGGNALCSSGVPTPLEEKATESAFLSPASRFWCLLSVCFLLLILAANLPLIARIVGFY